MSVRRLAALAALTAAAVLVAVSLHDGRSVGAADPAAMDAMSVDMDITGNTATSLGPWDQCIVASPGDTVTIDITATGIPAAYPMLAFAYTLNFPAGVVTVESEDSNFLLAALPGSTVWSVSETLPDGDGAWIAAAVDIGTSHESGSGVLDRITLSLAPGAPAGIYGLGLPEGEAAHIDPTNNIGRPPNAINNAFIAINATCENLPTPTPTPVPTPTPPPTPLPWILGDVDCSGLVNAVDGMKLTQFEVGFPVAQVEPCPDIGGSSVGDVDCDGYTNVRDSLSIVRFISALTPLSSQPGCPEIGTGTDGVPNTVPDGGTPTPGPNGYAVSVTSADADAGGQTSVVLKVSVPQSGMAAYSIDVAFDPDVVAAVSCSTTLTGTIVGSCNPEFAPGKVRIAAVRDVGLTGEINVASITFHANAPGVSALTPVTSMLLDTEGSPRSTTITPGSLTIHPASSTPAPSPVPGAPPPFDPGGVICFENLESPPECDGDTTPGAATDIRSKHCVGWSDDCTARNFGQQSNFGGFLSFTPPGWHVPAGNTIPVGAIAGRINAEGTLGILNNACNSRIHVEFTMLNASTDTGSLIPAGLSGDPMAPLAIDANGNGVPDGADRYPAFLANLLPGVQPRARLFGITHIQGSWITVNTLVFDPGATLTIGGTSVTFDPGLGYPSGTILQDPTAQAAPGWITDFCAPFLAQDIVLGKTVNNPCSPVRVAGANCPVTSNVLPESREHGYPALPCDVRNTIDDDGDGTINDGCPRVNAVPEVGAECNNAISDDGEDSSVNDGCPQIGDVSEGARMPGSCSGGDEGGCTYRSNPAAAGPATFTTLNLSQRDADGDGIENSLDVCALIPNGEWDPRALDLINDPDNDGLPSVCDPNPNEVGPPAQAVAAPATQVQTRTWTASLTGPTTARTIPSSRIPASRRTDSPTGPTLPTRTATASATPATRIPQHPTAIMRRSASSSRLASAAPQALSSGCLTQHPAWTV